MADSSRLLVPSADRLLSSVLVEHSKRVVQGQSAVRPAVKIGSPLSNHPGQRDRREREKEKQGRSDQTYPSPHPYQIYSSILFRPNARGSNVDHHQQVMVRAQVMPTNVSGTSDF